MKETELYAKIRPHLMAWGECDRVENTLSSGMSDVFYNIGGKTGWIETKVAQGDLILFEKFQPNWIAKHHRLGARIFIMVLDKKQAIHVYPAGVILNARRFSHNGKVAVNMAELPPVFNMPSPYRSWKSVREILTS